FLTAGPLQAQKEKPRAVGLPPEGEDAFTSKNPQYREASTRFKTFTRTDPPPEKVSKDNPDDQKAIDLTAQYYTYRLTWEKLNDKEGEVTKLVEEFERQVDTAVKVRATNPAFTEMYLKQLALRVKDVIQTRQAIAAVNAGRMLAKLADTGSEEAGD